MAKTPDPKASDSAATGREPTARTKHGELTLDQIGALMPGLGGLMPIISERFGWMFHAAKAGNWELARYQLRKVRKLFRVGKMTRPKWTATIDAYDEAFLAPIDAAINVGSWHEFEGAARRAVDEANRIHVETGYGYIEYRIPGEPPAHMTLEPPESGAGD